MKTANKMKIHFSILMFFLLAAYQNCGGRFESQTESLPAKLLGTDTGNPLVLSGVAQLPKIYLNSNYPTLPVDRKTLLVGENKPFKTCQAAVDAARPGDEVVIDARFVCSALRLVDKGPSNEAIVIRSSNWSQLPPQGQRLRREDATHLAVVETSVDDYAVYAAEKARNYHLTGLEIRVRSDFKGALRGLISVGPWYLTPLDQLPSQIVFSKVWIHGSATQETLGGVRLNGSAISIVDSIIEEIHSLDESAPAIAGWKMGAGPFKIVNNELLAAGGGLVLGGYTSSPDQIPSDIEVRKNWVHQKVEWRSSVRTLSGRSGLWKTGSLLSLNNAQRVLISGNIFENQWARTDVVNYGYAIELSPDALSNGTAGSGQQWVRVQDINFVNNIVRNAAGAFNIVYQNFEVPAAITQRVEISNNLVYNIGFNWGTSLGMILLRQEAQGPVVFNHNTLLNVEGGGPQLLNPWSRGLYSYFTFTNNLCGDKGDGIKDSNNATGSATLAAMFPGVVFSNNVLAGQNPSLYPQQVSSNHFPMDFAGIGFASDPSTVTSNYQQLRLAPTSSFLGRASDGFDIGVNFSWLEPSLR